MLLRGRTKCSLVIVPMPRFIIEIIGVGRKTNYSNVIDIADDGMFVSVDQATSRIQTD